MSQNHSTVFAGQLPASQHQCDLGASLWRAFRPKASHKEVACYYWSIWWPIASWPQAVQVAGAGDPEGKYPQGGHDGCGELSGRRLATSIR